ncbi:hypothetical protein Hanom_Chr00s000004g01609651 [Helianthus anomalus]
MLATACLAAIEPLIIRFSSCIESLDIPMFADHWEAPPISGCLTIAGDDGSDLEMAVPISMFEVVVVEIQYIITTS